MRDRTVGAQLTEALRLMVERDYHCGICYMEYYYRDPRWRCMPPDEQNVVTAIFKLKRDWAFKMWGKNEKYFRAT